MHIIDYDKLIAELENKPTEILTNRPTVKKSEFKKNEESEIKTEERFEEITEESPTDMKDFHNLIKEMGIPTLANQGKGENFSVYMIKKDYITEPESHPYHEFLEEKEKNKKKAHRISKLIQKQKHKPLTKK